MHNNSIVTYFCLAYATAAEALDVFVETGELGNFLCEVNFQLYCPSVI